LWARGEMVAEDDGIDDKCPFGEGWLAAEIEQSYSEGGIVKATVAT
jgi:hypothetical protein